MGFKVGGASEMLFARTVKAPCALNRTRKASWSKIAACLLFPSLCSNALQLSQDCLEYGIETGIVIFNNGPCIRNRLINTQHMKQNSQKLMSLHSRKPLISEYVPIRRIHVTCSVEQGTSPRIVLECSLNFGVVIPQYGVPVRYADRTSNELLRSLIRSHLRERRCDAEIDGEDIVSDDFTRSFCIPHARNAPDTQRGTNCEECAHLFCLPLLHVRTETEQDRDFFHRPPV